MPHTHHTTLISAANLHERLTAAPGSVLVFDCRFDLANPAAGENAYALGHLPGAQYLHLDRDLSGPKTGKNGRHPLPDRSALVATLLLRGLNEGQQVVAYDAQGGAYAARLWWLLRWLGHDSVAVLDGGLNAWEAAGFPLVRDVPTPARGTFKAGAPLQVTVDAQAIVRNLATHELTVVDARAADRYRGENETIDPVGGHIPGARNRFYQDNLTPDGRFKSAHALREDFMAVLPGITPEHVVLQCGSGVTACHNALAMEIAGLHGAALYPGSWSEWSADPSRPVATGPNP
ncbi:sulfurtransferase [Paraburkholderia silvatlantica]|uniref:Sulfurtransferase n=1 Tax=Paraburkholderia silvatlantica TaxID=321895 RepID=A0A2U1A7M6_9BURK|nr:sulfurtransferase [Paraburkholderia silvatlantica]MBB2931315.1 thiosulfate/3-mercaptopyruvate sulfurtransferase [Paraburkholderia silvatlantica]PVY28250.1 thiosulfate/3-mercaptopyruvate sulfurtransferase [Paraburkholderia silvatlantica]PXW34935.1 thiosulfate/3-mercaptopyruvate sulfurtransferase [Paraburkholderia silvatlantica]PYE15242.1 thiosulfate/3-mercaptopyruvate sulfurtransferase [Paraburkholderia silvatlantica]TDQ98842.1 thiosulfate/3-mercaptopyruvate sulfurtransferase [Paraburkholder